MPSKPGRDSRRPYQCARNRRLTTTVPWDERGDFVCTALADWAEHEGSSMSAMMMTAMEWYFTNRTPDWFYKQTVEKIETAEFKRLHRPEKGGICHRLSCAHCYSKRSAIAEANRSLQSERDRG